MNKFSASDCCGFFACIGQESIVASIVTNPAYVQKITETEKAGVLARLEVIDEKIDELREELSTNALGFCVESDLPESAKLIRHIVDVQFAERPVRYTELQWTLAELQRLMRSEMSSKLFFCISQSSSKMFDDPFPMLSKVAEHFPEAQYDIKEAFNCLVLDRGTATVFHSMRVAEHGMRYLAKKLKVKLTHKGKPQPIESATWDKIISAIKNKITAAHGLPHGIRRFKQLAYYSDMADRCSYMKDLWRNDIMHSRRSFNDAEARGVLQRVTGFMQLLAGDGEDEVKPGVQKVQRVDGHDPSRRPASRKSRDGGGEARART